MSDHLSRRAIAIGAVLLTLTAACGTRLGRDEILAAGATKDADMTSEDRPSGDQGDDGGIALGDGATPATGGAAGDGTTTGARPSSGTGDATDGAGPRAGAIGTPGETGPIVVGNVGSYSGAASATAEGMGKGVQVWAADLNARGGLFGREVRVVQVDDGGDPVRHVAALRDLVENRKVVAFVSNYGVFTAASGASYIKSSGVPVIGGSCTLEVEQTDPFFSQCTRIQDTYVNVLRTGVRFANAKKVALIYCSEAQVCRDANTVLNAGGAAATAGAQIVYNAQVSIAQPDFTSECINARNAGAQAIFAPVDSNTVIRIAASCSRQGYRPRFIATHNVTADVRHNVGLENVLLALPNFPFTASSVASHREFYAAWDEYSSGDAGAQAAQGWLAGKLFEIAAIKAAATSQSLNPKSLLEAMRTIEGETLDNLAVTLDFTGGRSDNAPCWWVMEANSKDGWTLLNNGELACP